MMKTALLALFFVFGASFAKAAPLQQTYVVTRTSFSASAQNPTMFSSHTIQFIGVLVSSPVLDGRMVIYRSTSSSFTLDVSSQVVINTNLAKVAPNDVVPLHDLTNTSYTYVQKLGAAETTIFFRCVGETNVGVCPGLRWNAQK